jgi:hypothetical protein
VVGQAKQFSAQIAAGVKQAPNAMGQLKLDRLRHGMKRWVGLGVISDNLINIGRAINAKSSD